MNFYLRQGGWCSCERSCNSASLGLEDGVSAYECDGSGPWAGRGEAFAKRERAFRGQQRRLLGGLSPWYLVTGDVVGTGADGEPLLKNVVAHREIAWDGQAHFVDVGACASPIVALHPEHPSCRCMTPDDLDAHDAEQSGGSSGDDLEDDLEPLEIEF